MKSKRIYTDIKASYSCQCKACFNHSRIIFSFVSNSYLQNKLNPTMTLRSISVSLLLVGISDQVISDSFLEYFGTSAANIVSVSN